MKMFDIEKTVHAITTPFATMIEGFDQQMNQLHKEVQKSNELLEQILEELRNEE